MSHAVYALMLYDLHMECFSAILHIYPFPFNLLHVTVYVLCYIGMNKTSMPIEQSQDG